MRNNDSLIYETLKNTLHVEGYFLSWYDIKVQHLNVTF
ncbi:hypothetical protein ACINWC743_3445 [Acinetobacter sp. WC-743]|nr:hypothetical protein ACINWC743_3445 [Acinetobacter sp. WC-743]